ncbi:preprotein translocase subunit SecY [Amycolatopsis umgeniensis]|uniref:Preprotein translocase subunit SecY n=1 Tax=Amycolatopsis umgeniensis TaxID=336628 RepID=A0A841AUA2_9PSEU|nr:preprotein translocase subunit SecY [Amycolatopsis umgeniensis]MBB5850567.1 preprotein translocase subunit SecY [Amycolatopsis umgeniensis]
MNDSAERTADRGSLRHRILVTLLVIVVFRLGQSLTAPHVDVRAIEGTSKIDNPLYWLLDLFTGGGLFTLPVFAFGVLPCLAALPLMRTLIVLVPRLATLRAEGQAGARLLTRYQRRLTVALGFLGAVGVVVFRGEEVLGDGAVTVACLTAGTALVLRLTEVITDRGFGDGVRILLLVQVVAVLPPEFLRLYEAKGWIGIAVMAVVALSVMVITIVFAQTQRRIPVQYAKRMIGIRAYGGTSSYIPLRISQANSPAVLAAVLLYLPVLASDLWPGVTWFEWIGSRLRDEGTPWRIAIYLFLVCLFAFIRAAGTFDVEQVSRDLARTGGFIPGIQPGGWTVDYLGYVYHWICAFGAVYAGVIAVIPATGLALLDASPRFPFGGVALLVVLVFLVSVTLDTARQINELRVRKSYGQFLR